MEYSQAQNQKQTLRFSPHQIQLLNLLQLNSLAIEQKIKDEIEENPALEEGKEDDLTNENNDEDIQTDIDENDITDSSENDFNLEDYIDDGFPDYKTFTSNRSKDDEATPFFVTERMTFRDQLKEQLQSFKFDTQSKSIAYYLIDSLDEDGYLRQPITDLIDDYSFAKNTLISEDDAINVLKYIQNCEPYGVGARSLKECLLIQLYRKNTNDKATANAISILENYFIEISNRNFSKIIRDTNLTQKEFQEALKIITHLNPKPVEIPGRDDEMINTIIPEFQIVNNEGTLEILLNDQTLPELHLNKKYVELIEQMKDENQSTNNKTNKNVIQFIKQKINSAKWFIDAIQQRQSSMLKTMEAIVHIQYEYFLTGDIKKLKPMILKDVAKLINIDISTASRVTSSKYAQTSFGTIRLKDLFTSVILKKGGEEISNKEIHEIISELVSQEDKTNPLTDMEIAQELKIKGYNTARRTIAKYREHIGIPIARMRKSVE